MNEKKVKIPNMTCNHCAMHIKDEADKIAGAGVKEINLETKEVTFTLEKQEDWAVISKNLEEIGYSAEEL